MGLIREMFVVGQYMNAQTSEEIAELNKRQRRYDAYRDAQEEAFFAFFAKIGRLFK